MRYASHFRNENGCIVYHFHQNAVYYHYFREGCMKRRFALLLLAAVVAFPGCNSSTGNDDDNSGNNNGGNNNGGTITAGNYLPFKNGNTWTFSSTDEYGTSISTDTITGSTTIDGKSYWTMTSQASGVDPETTYFRVADNNLYTFFDTSVYTDMGGITAKGAKIARAFKTAASDLGPEVIIAKFGVSAGNTWTIYDITLPTGEKVSVKGKYAGLLKVETPAGTFANCAEFEMTVSYSGTVEGASVSMTTTSYQWYAPGVGPVKIVSNLEMNYAGQKMTFGSSDILKSYTVQ